MLGLDVSRQERVVSHVYCVLQRSLWAKMHEGWCEVKRVLEVLPLFRAQLPPSQLMGTGSEVRGVRWRSICLFSSMESMQGWHFLSDLATWSLNSPCLICSCYPVPLLQLQFLEEILTGLHLAIIGCVAVRRIGMTLQKCFKVKLGANSWSMVGSSPPESSLK